MWILKTYSMTFSNLIGYETAFICFKNKKQEENLEGI